MAQDNNHRDGAMDVIFGIVFIPIVLFLIWQVFHAGIIKFYIGLWSIEVWIAQLFTDQFIQVDEFIHKINPKTMEFTKFIQTANEIGTLTNKISFLILLGLAYYTYKKSPYENFKKAHSTKSLIEVSVKEWPQIFPVIGLNLLKEDENKIKAFKKEIKAAEKENREVRYTIAKGWDPAMNEWELARAYKLVNSDMTLNQTRAEVLMIKQLGLFFSSPKNFSIPRKAIYALLILRAHRKMDEYKQLRGNLAKSFNNQNNTLFNGHVKLSEIDAIIDNYADSSVLKKIKRNHAYQTTLLVSLLNEARNNSGVLASADFIWLRPMDRVLWYSLNGFGRRVAFSEAAGVRAHWLAEIMMKKRVESPMISEAVEALREALITNPELMPDEDI